MTGQRPVAERPTARAIVVDDWGRVLLFQIRYFLVRVGDGEIRLDGLDAIERGVYRGHRWWRLDELESTAETVYPARLADLLLAHVGRPAPDCA